MEAVNQQLEDEKKRHLELAQKQGAGGGSGETGGSKANWRDEELQILIKAVNLFPAGTVAR